MLAAAKVALAALSVTAGWRLDWLFSKVLSCCLSLVPAEPRQPAERAVVNEALSHENAGVMAGEG